MAKAYTKIGDTNDKIHQSLIYIDEIIGTREEVTGLLEAIYLSMPPRSIRFLILSFQGGAFPPGYGLLSGVGTWHATIYKAFNDYGLIMFYSYDANKTMLKKRRYDGVWYAVETV